MGTCSRGEGERETDFRFADQFSLDFEYFMYGAVQPTHRWAGCLSEGTQLLRGK